jgi:hypothetical protein
VAQWGMAPVIDATELRLLRLAYRRALGVPEMPSPKFLDELAHELKDQFASNADLRYESELFYEYQSRANRSARELDAHVLSTNDDTVCSFPGPSIDRSPLTANVCRKIEMIQEDLAEIRPGWFHVGSKERAGNNFPVCLRYVIKPFAQNSASRSMAWMPMQRMSSGR